MPCHVLLLRSIPLIHDPIRRKWWRGREWRVDEGKMFKGEMVSCTKTIPISYHYFQEA